MFVFNNFLKIAVNIENARLKIALATPTGAPITVANYVIAMLHLLADKTIKNLSKLKEVIYSLSLLHINYLPLISAIN